MRRVKGLFGRLPKLPRRVMSDSDRDGMPNPIDCAPYNRRRMGKKIIARVVHAPDASESTVFVGKRRKTFEYDEEMEIEDYWKKMDRWAKSKKATHIRDPETGTHKIK